MYRKHRCLFLLVGVAFGLILASGCVVYDGDYGARGGVVVSGPAGRPVPPGHPYRYHYYPASEVYYYPDSGTYFWIEGGNWVSGLHLPGRFHLAVDNWLWLELDSPKPYRYHHRTKRKYPHSYHSTKPPKRPRTTRKAPTSSRPEPPKKESKNVAPPGPPGVVPAPPDKPPRPPVPGVPRKRTR